MSSPPQSGAFPRMIFGPFVYDGASGELHKHGVRIRLQGQPLHILSAMLRRSGEVVSREEFRQELWPLSAFVDFDHGLNAAMNRLRQTLGDSADQPRYIETLPGRGYRFIAPVQEASPKPLVLIAPPVPPEKPDELSPRRQRSPSKTAWLACMAGAALTACFIAGYLAHRQHEHLRYSENSGSAAPRRTG